MRWRHLVATAVCASACGGATEAGPPSGRVTEVVQWPPSITLKAVAVSGGVTFVGGFYDSRTSVTLPGGIVLPPSQGVDGLVARVEGGAAAKATVVAGPGTDAVNGLANDRDAGVAAAILSNDSPTVVVGSIKLDGPAAKLIVARFDGTANATSAQSFATEDASVRSAQVASSRDGELVVGFEATGGSTATSMGGIGLSGRSVAGFLRLTAKDEVLWAKAIAMGLDPIVRVWLQEPAVTMADDGTATLAVATDSLGTANDFGVVDPGGGGDLPGRLVVVHVDRAGLTRWFRAWPASSKNYQVAVELSSSRDGNRVALVGASGNGVRTEFTSFEPLRAFAMLLDATNAIPIWYRSEDVSFLGTPRVDDQGRVWASVLVSQTLASLDGVRIDPNAGERPGLVRFGSSGRIDTLRMSKIDLGSSAVFTAADLDTSGLVAVAMWNGTVDWGDGVNRAAAFQAAVSLEWTADEP